MRWPGRCPGSSGGGRTAALCLTLLSAAGPACGAAQEPRGIEAGVELLTTRAAPAFWGAGPALAIRPGGSARFVLNLAPGVQRRRLAGRAELLAELMLTPARRTGVAFYGLAGIAGQAGRRDAGWLVLGLGLEAAPATRSGWHLEAGIGGGARLAVGWRWRRLTRGPPP